MTFWTDKEGKKLSFKEFMARWRSGIQAVTPLQSTRSQLMFSYIVLVGLIGGIIVSLLAWKTLWWLVITLIGTLGIQVLGLIGTYQKYVILKNIENMMKGGENEIESNKQ